jgi:hypothetical protein
MQRLCFPAALLLCSIACGGGVSSTDEGTSDVAAAGDQLFTVRRDERRCPAPACGGFVISAIAKNAAPSYVTDLDLTQTALDAAAQQMVLSAPGEELLIKGRLSAADPRGLRKLLVKDAWRGMPGIVPAAKDAFYSVAPRAPQHVCAAAPCNNQIATEAGSGKATALTRVSVHGASRAFVDQAWLQNRVALYGALVAAHVAAGQKLAAGTETVLEASQVWLHLPESAGPCAMPREQVCGAGQVQAYARTADRCLQAVGCVARGVCPMMQPSCPAGYVASTWASAPNGCTATACDPAWVNQ